MIESLAFRMANAIKKIEPSKTASVEIMKFSIEALLNNLITLCLVVLLALVTNTVEEALIGLVCFSFLRFFSGGYHFRSALLCTIVSTILITISAHVYLSDFGIYVLMAVSFLLILIFAPSNISNHARIPHKYFPYLKLVSLGIVSSNFIFLDSTVATAFLLQSITLLFHNKEVKL